jgi:hypothetical protein
MATYEFRDELQVEFRGCSFTVQVNDKLGQTLTAFKKKCIKLAESPEAKTMTESEVVAIGAESLDAIFGAGAFDKIFQTRKATFQDITDILFFLQQEIDKLTKRTLARDMKKMKKGKKK